MRLIALKLVVPDAHVPLSDLQSVNVGILKSASQALSKAGRVTSAIAGQAVAHA
jgi:hypothetical protein